MTEEPVVVIPIKKQQRENKQQEKKEFVPSTIRNEIDIDVSMLERKESSASVAETSETAEE